MNNFTDNMKRMVFLLMSCCLVINAFAQSCKRHTMGAHVAFGDDSYTNYFGKRGDNFEQKYYYSIGLDYALRLSKRWDFCTGLEYSQSKMLYNPRMYPPQPSDANLKMTILPLQLKFRFGKFFFVNTGPLLNLFLKETIVRAKESNYYRMILGWELGVGGEYEFKNGIMLSLKPSIRKFGLENQKSIEKNCAIAPQGAVYYQAGASLCIGYKF